MTAQAQTLVVTNSGQPLAADIAPATTYSVAQTTTPTAPGNVTVTIAPSAD